jgi:hypothetical protein
MLRKYAAHSIHNNEYIQEIHMNKKHTNIYSCFGYRACVQKFEGHHRHTWSQGKYLNSLKKPKYYSYPTREPQSTYQTEPCMYRYVGIWSVVCSKVQCCRCCLRWLATGISKVGNASINAYFCHLPANNNSMEMAMSWYQSVKRVIAFQHSLPPVHRLRVNNSENLILQRFLLRV